MITEKIYESDGLCASFTANLKKAFPTEHGYALLLDRTAFFPEGGGQSADTGRIGGVRVIDVQIKDGEILHFTEELPKEKSNLPCQIDFEVRLRRMQNHLGEHLLCGAFHKLYGAQNVGFHLGSDSMTFDIDRQLSEEEILAAEHLANRAVAEDALVHCYYPENASALEYRAKSEKLEHADAIRIVEVEGYDRCACCAPHLDRAGKVGIIKIIDAMHYKGGTRFTALCGLDALADYEWRLSILRQSSALLSAKTEEIVNALTARQKELSEAKRTIGALKRELTSYKLASIAPTDQSICIFDPSMDAVVMRDFATQGKAKTKKLFAIFSGNGQNGYQFVIASEHIPLREQIPVFTEAFRGKCGGSDKMLFGQACIPEEEIRRIIADIQ